MNCPGSYETPLGHAYTDEIGEVLYGICRVCRFKKRLYHADGRRFVAAHRAVMHKWEREQREAAPR